MYTLSREKYETETVDYNVSIIGGYNDERDISNNITNMLLREMQSLDARFRLSLALTGLTNTEMRDNIPWPRVYGGGVDVLTGEVFTAMFSYHGPDTDIRALRLHSPGAMVTNIYDHKSGNIVIQPFTYLAQADADLWLRRSDSYLLSHCSTSPLVEPPGFCGGIRAVLRRMISDPEPGVTLFPGGECRIYRLVNTTNIWQIQQQEGKVDQSNEKRQSIKTWGLNDFIKSFN